MDSVADEVRTASKPRLSVWRHFGWCGRRLQLRLALSGMFVVGLIIATLVPACLVSHDALPERLRNVSLPDFVGLVMCAPLLASQTVGALIGVVRSWMSIDKQYHEELDFLAPDLVGACEAIMYPFALASGNPDFIGLWLAIKVAGTWSRWGGTGEDVNVANEGRRRFQVFLCGNALSVMFWSGDLVHCDGDRALALTPPPPEPAPAPQTA